MIQRRNLNKIVKYQTMHLQSYLLLDRLIIKLNIEKI